MKERFVRPGDELGDDERTLLNLLAWFDNRSAEPTETPGSAPPTDDPGAAPGAEAAQRPATNGQRAEIPAPARSAPAGDR